MTKKRYKYPRNFDFCPRCGGCLPNYPGALSRVDNTTEICSDCGTAEAMDDYMLSLTKKTPLTNPTR